MSCVILGSGYTGNKPNGPVTQKHHWFSVLNPQRYAGFCHAQISGSAQLCAVVSRLRGMVWATRKDVRTAEPVFLTTMLHQLHSKMQTVVPMSRSGAKTMTATLRAHTAAPTSTQATTVQEAIAAHIGIHNALSMANWHIAKGNTPAAARKVRQALAALRQLDKLEG